MAMFSSKKIWGQFKFGLSYIQKCAFLTIFKVSIFLIFGNKSYKI